MIDFEPFVLSLQLAFCTTLLLLVIGIPIAYWLAFSRFKGKPFIEALISLPLVLPPSVLGFYLLLAFSPENAFGKFLDQYFDIHLVFTFPGLVIASVLYSFPFMVQPIQNGFKSITKNLIDASYTLGKTKFETFKSVIIPNSKNAILTGIILSFAHTIGEFGVVLIIGGSIPSETKVISIAIYDEVQAMNYQNATFYAGSLVLFSFLILIAVYSLNHRFTKISPLS